MIRRLALVLVCLGCAAPAFAQQNDHVGPFVFDVRGIFARHKIEPSVATDLQVNPGNVPTRSWGAVAGAHYYFWHTKHITLGAGGDVLWAHGGRTLAADATTGTGTTTTTTGTTEFPPATVDRHFLSFAPEFSLNFGHHNGWSYISGGMYGASRLYLDRADAPATNVGMRRTLNYGGGARWFTNDRIAFAVDFHWYSVAELPANPAANLVAEPRTTLLVLSGGISIR
jgi:hypothetical protein